MKPNKDLNGVENVVALIKDSNPSVTFTADHVTFDPPQALTGIQTSIRLTGNGQGNVTGEQTVTYDRQPVQNYLPSMDFFYTNGETGLDILKEQYRQTYGLVVDQVTVDIARVPDANEALEVKVTPTGDLTYQTEVGKGWIASEDLSDPTKLGTGSGITDGRGLMDRVWDRTGSGLLIGTAINGAGVKTTTFNGYGTVTSQQSVASGSFSIAGTAVVGDVTITYGGVLDLQESYDEDRAQKYSQTGTLLNTSESLDNKLRTTFGVGFGSHAVFAGGDGNLQPGVGSGVGDTIRVSTGLALLGFKREVITPRGTRGVGSGVKVGSYGWIIGGGYDYAELTGPVEYRRVNERDKINSDGTKLSTNTAARYKSTFDNTSTVNYGLSIYLLSSTTVYERFDSSGVVVGANRIIQQTEKFPIYATGMVEQIVFGSRLSSAFAFIGETSIMHEDGVYLNSTIALIDNLSQNSPMMKCGFHTNLN